MYKIDAVNIANPEIPKKDEDTCDLAIPYKYIKIVGTLKKSSLGDLATAVSGSIEPKIQ